MTDLTLREKLDRDGYVQPAGSICPSLLTKLDQNLTNAAKQAGRRDLLAEVPCTNELLADPFIAQTVKQLFDNPAFVVRATLFDKRPGSNWSVTWHQDQAIAVETRHDVVGFGPWSTKNGVDHVEPPVRVLENMTAIRLHLEDCTAAHGPLVVSPQTHRLGRVCGDAISAAIQDHGEHPCTLNAGQALVIKPLTLHRSSKMQGDKRRRVIHLDCTDQPLPPPLAWKYQAKFQNQ